jgi:hypothetical protein
MIAHLCVPGKISARQAAWPPPQQATPSMPAAALPRCSGTARGTAMQPPRLATALGVVARLASADGYNPPQEAPIAHSGGEASKYRLAARPLIAFQRDRTLPCTEEGAPGRTRPGARATPVAVRVRRGAEGAQLCRLGGGRPSCSAPPQPPPPLGICPLGRRAQVLAGCCCPPGARPQRSAGGGSAQHTLPGDGVVGSGERRRHRRGVQAAGGRQRRQPSAGASLRRRRRQPRRGRSGREGQANGARAV